MYSSKMISEPVQNVQELLAKKDSVTYKKFISLIEITRSGFPSCDHSQGTFLGYKIRVLLL